MCGAYISPIRVELSIIDRLKNNSGKGQPYDEDVIKERISWKNHARAVAATLIKTRSNRLKENSKPGLLNEPGR